MVISLTMKLITLQSQVVATANALTAVGYCDDSLANTNTNNNNMDADWFLNTGKFYMKLPAGGGGDDDDELLLSSRNTLYYNNTAFLAADDDNDNNSTSTNILVRIRQVPSDGSCLFHAIGATILHDEMMMMMYQQQHQQQFLSQHHHHHPHMSSVIQYSQTLRQQAVNALQYNPQRQFTMKQGDEPITASSLVQLAAMQYGISSEEYLTSMRDKSVWGGGPEIMALASLVLQRQIVILEPEKIIMDNNVVCSSSDDVVHFLKIRARLGDDASKEDEGNNPIYILCTNQQFPESYGKGRIDNNHFLAVFPL